LLDQVAQAAHQRGASEPTTAQLVSWVRAFILFHGKRHPRELGLPDASRFLEHVVRTEKQPLPALETARSALELLYGTVLGIDLGELPRPRPPRLLDQMSQVLRVRHYSPRTEACYLHWVRQFILFHGKRHPRDQGAAEVEQFLTHLAVKRHVSASTQNQALNALVFLYQQVLEIDLGRFEAVRARRPKRLPVVLAPDEVAAVLARVEGGEGTFRLMARLLYGCGLRLMECCRLRVKDIELSRGQIVVRGGKGNKDRVVMLPRSVRADLEHQLGWRRQLHERDLARGVARVELPDALERKYPRAVQELGWQFVFASRQLSRCPRTGRLGRHHVYPSSLQRAVGQAGRAVRPPPGIGQRPSGRRTRPASCLRLWPSSSSPRPPPARGVKAGPIPQIAVGPRAALGAPPANRSLPRQHYCTSAHTRVAGPAQGSESPHAVARAWQGCWTPCKRALRHGASRWPAVRHYEGGPDGRDHSMAHDNQDGLEHSPNVHNELPHLSRTTGSRRFANRYKVKVVLGYLVDDFPSYTRHSETEAQPQGG
jgi:integron integrase